jgi:hypothetical protein
MKGEDYPPYVIQLEDCENGDIIVREGGPPTQPQTSRAVFRNTRTGQRYLEPRVKNSVLDGNYFPNISPSRRRIVFGDYEVNRYGSDQEVTMPLPTTAQKNDVIMDLVFANRRDEIARMFMDHYDQCSGEFYDFPIAPVNQKSGTFAGWDDPDTRNIRRGRWIYTRPPRIEQTAIGHSTTTIQILNLVPELMNPDAGSGSGSGGGSGSGSSGGGPEVPPTPSPGPGDPVEPPEDGRPDPDAPPVIYPPRETVTYWKITYDYNSETPTDLKSNYNCSGTPENDRDDRSPCDEPYTALGPGGITTTTQDPVWIQLPAGYEIGVLRRTVSFTAHRDRYTGDGSSWNGGICSAANAERCRTLRIWKAPAGTNPTVYERNEGAYAEGDIWRPFGNTYWSETSFYYWVSNFVIRQVSQEEYENR